MTINVTKKSESDYHLKASGSNGKRNSRVSHISTLRSSSLSLSLLFLVINIIISCSSNNSKASSLSRHKSPSIATTATTLYQFSVMSLGWQRRKRRCQVKAFFNLLVAMVMMLTMMAMSGKLHTTVVWHICLMCIIAKFMIPLCICMIDIIANV